MVTRKISKPRAKRPQGITIKQKTRTISIAQLRSLVLARITKGNAFSMNGAEYEIVQNKWIENLAPLNAKEIKTAFPDFTRDITIKEAQNANS